MKRFKIAALAALATLASCSAPKQQDEDNKTKETMSKDTTENVDHHSYSKPDEAVVTHLKWKANVNFDEKVINATATFDINNIKGVDTIYLDSRNLDIHEVNRDDHEGSIEFAKHFNDEILGTQLAIPITKKTKKISINYSTTKGADALQFLDPQQTAGKKQPFLFTQSEAILARTWIPCQDSPGIRFTYEAEVTVPKGMLALMSAENPTEVDSSGVYHFKMKKAIPSYLLALAAGDIAFHKLGKITGVYAEPSVIKAATYEFAQMQDMVDTAASLYGPYRWGEYDVIVLPPSFPFGGMENPRLTFATPTIIAGDRSLTALIAHELAHSWSGNLVTNATWEDIWLNEGFTVYFEQRIMEEINGKEYANMLAVLTHQELVEEVAMLKAEGRYDDTKLKVDLIGRDPDKGLTGIPYDKGYFLLRLIEETVGREQWDGFLKEYFNKFAFQSMTTAKFLTYIKDSLFAENPEWNKTINIDQWVYENGIPDNCPNVVSQRFDEVAVEAKAWKGGKKATILGTKEWMTPEWLRFIRLLPDTLTIDQMNDLDNAFSFTTSGNSEIKAAWFIKVIPNNYTTADKEVEKFLIEVGRRKFLVPIYKAIIESKEGKKRAVEIYQKARPNYHPVSRDTIDELLDIK